jgi:hypothetical protein
MIDIDKYEGHSTDSRIWYEYSRGLTSEHTDGRGRADQADENLVADAPLLLEEVKRLREQLLRGVKLMNKTPNQTKEGRRNWAKRFEREVREMIE